MYARMGFVDVAPRAFEQAVKMVRTQALPSLRLQEGFRGALFFGDRERGRAVYATLWETEEALRASERVAAELREDTAGALESAEIPVERYEVFVFEVPGGAAD